MSDMRGQEVVTHALVRDVTLPHGAGTAALITLDNGQDHTRPNTFGPAGLAELAATLSSLAAREDIVAICLTGKPYVLAAGADLTGVPLIRGGEQAARIARLGHDTFRRLGEMPVPTFAFVNGLALGGGLEVALHCTYRTVSTAAGAIGLPECQLGLIPGWGGSYLLPRLVGPDRAVSVIIEGALTQRTLSGPQALDLGLADAMFEPANFLEQSLQWTALVLRGEEVLQRSEHTDDPAAWAGAVARGRAIADARVHAAAPAPYRALDLIAAARTRSRDEGFAAEDEALADLMMGPELRASLYAFDLVQRRAKRLPGGVDASLARPVTKVGVVGAGLMAGQLALLFARRLLVPVVMTDVDADRLEAGVRRVHDDVDKLLAKKRLSPPAAARVKALVTGAPSIQAFADADLVIEAVFEELSVKQQVFGELEAVVSPTCLLATNTSSLPLADMAAKLAHPERVLGMHFFNPVAVMPLLEIARTAQTDEATYATGFVVSQALRKSCVAVHDAPAYVVNRLLARLFGEVIRAIDAGTPPQVADGALAPLGLPMTALELAGFTGVAVTVHVSETLQEAFGARFHVSPTLRRLVAAGRPIEDLPAAYEPPSPPVVLSAEEVRRCALDALADEVGRLLAEEVVGAPQDVDLCLLTGAGFPFHLGGITPYLDSSGVSERVLGRRLLPAGLASVPD